MKLPAEIGTRSWVSNYMTHLCDEVVSFKHLNVNLPLCTWKLDAVTSLIPYVEMIYY